MISVNFCPSCGEKRYNQYNYCGNCGFEFLNEDIRNLIDNKSMYDSNKKQLYIDYETNVQYKYYKIYRHDGYITYCTIVNWIHLYFERSYGKPNVWIESEEKAKIRGEILPIKIEAESNGYTFIIELIKQEYIKIPLRYEGY